GGQAAEDALQGAMARACSRWSRVRNMGAPEAYVRRVAINEILSVHRRPAARLNRALLDQETTRQPPLGTGEGTSSLEDRDELGHGVLSLPLRQRAVIVLRYYEDLSEAEIAETLHCRPGTVKSQASAALAKLRDSVPARRTEGLS